MSNKTRKSFAQPMRKRSCLAVCRKHKSSLQIAVTSQLEVDDQSDVHVEETEIACTKTLSQRSSATDVAEHELTHSAIQVMVHALHMGSRLRRSAPMTGCCHRETAVRTFSFDWSSQRYKNSYQFEDCR